MVGPVHIRATRRGLEKVRSDLAEVLRLMELANMYQSGSITDMGGDSPGHGDDGRRGLARSRQPVPVSVESTGPAGGSAACACTNCACSSRSFPPCTTPAT